MSRHTAGLRAEILGRIAPLVDRITDYLVGENVGLGAYALVNVLVACWRKIPLSREDLHSVIDEIWVTAEAVAAETQAPKN